MAAARPPVADRIERRLFLAADLLGEAAPRGEDAALDLGAEPREEARDRVERCLVLAHAPARDAAQQPDRVRVAGVGEDLVGRSLLDEPPGIEDPDALAHLRDDRQVVADEEDAGAELLAEGSDQLEHLGLDGGIEPRRGLVEDEERRVLRERHGDDDPLLHPSRQLMGIPPHHACGIRDLHLAQDFLGALPRLPALEAEQLEGLGDLWADADSGIQRGGGILVDHRKVGRPQPANPGAAHAQQVFPVDADGPRDDAAVSR
jgi:hypothetical protein